MMRNLRRPLPLLIAVLALAACASAYAVKAEIGPDWASATAQFSPKVLPKKGGAPIALSSITRIGNSEGKSPPALTTMIFLFDKNGYLDTKGLPTCTVAKLEGATPSAARKRCAGAMVGEGTGKAIVSLPGAAPVRVSSPLSFFNGPKEGGKPTVIVHAYETIPAPKALVLSVPIERIKHGRYGYRVQIEVPPIAGGYGAATLAEATIGATRKRGGKEVGYMNAACNGGRLQVYGTLSFANGNFFPAVLASSCHTPD
jgi:hypothetical protein